MRLFARYSNPTPSSVSQTIRHNACSDLKKHKIVIILRHLCQRHSLNPAIRPKYLFPLYNTASIQPYEEIIMSEEKRTCSFCGKSENDVKNLIEGEHAFICNECVETCGLMLQDNESGEIENEFAKVKEENAEKKTAYPCRNRCQPQRPRYRPGTRKKSVGGIGLQPLQTPAPSKSRRQG